ncbi:Hypothetical predicted protein [Mytilus galloprovincialis]|uniref:Uncharacterized protein n=1 Tax=Mytilus galloprovincialis TaxID=29158 RepID=A0A8B6BQA3_MYTGA|nr:Hypothetical predicted protein [Mytilus galloprovincialis]
MNPMLSLQLLQPQRREKQQQEMFMSFRGEIEKQKKEMKKLDLQIELLERIKSKEYQPMSLSQCLEALGSTN